MSGDTSERLDALFRCLERLQRTDPQLVAVTLEEYSLPLAQPAGDLVSRGALLSSLRHGSTETLINLAHFLSRPQALLFKEDLPFHKEGLKLFFSHLSKSRTFAEKVSERLKGLGVEVLVAHRDIEPSQDWQTVLANGLDQCDGLVAFIESGFRESGWCDQEIGWALGRHCPVLCLFRDGMAPYGLAGRLQGVAFESSSDEVVSEQILAWSSTGPLSGRLLESLVNAIEHSNSFDQTRTIVRTLRSISATRLSRSQEERLKDACKENSQVRDAVVPKMADFPFPRIPFEDWLSTYLVELA